MTTSQLVQNYYDSLAKKDGKWQELWSEDASFSDASKVLDVKGKAAVIQSFTQFIKGVEGVSVKQMIAEGEYACAIVSYVYINPKGEKMNQDAAEVWKVVEEKLNSLMIYFDLTVYRKFMGR